MRDQNQAIDADVISIHPVDPLVGVNAALDVSARKPRFTPTMATVAILPALLLGMLLGPLGVIPWIFGTFFLIWLIVILIHELGHLAAAWVAGFTIHAFAVGPIAIVRNGRSFRLMRVHGWGLSGFVLSTPDDPDNQRGWLAAYYVAGSLANFASGGLAWYAYVAFPDSSWMSLWEWTFIALSLIVGLFSIVPYRIGAIASDGLLLIRLFTMGMNSDQMRATLQLNSLLQHDMHPRDWDATVLAAALGHDSETPPEIGPAYLAYLHHLDAGRTAEATHFLGLVISHLKSMPIFFAAVFCAEAAYFFSQHGSDPALARAILRRLDGENVDDLTRMRAEAAVLLAEGNIDMATQVAQRAIRLTNDWPGAGGVAIERELIHRLLKLASAMPETVSSSANSNSELSAIVVPAL